MGSYQLHTSLLPHAPTPWEITHGESRQLLYHQLPWVRQLRIFVVLQKCIMDLSFVFWALCWQRLPRVCGESVHLPHAIATPSSPGSQPHFLVCAPAVGTQQRRFVDTVSFCKYLLVGLSITRRNSAYSY